MTPHLRGARHAVPLTTLTLGLASLVLAAPTAYAGGDRDDDGMPDRWERRHGLSAGGDDARGDRDRDGLANLAEFRRHGDPSDEDSDDDGHDDGDEVRDGHRGTRLDDRDGDDDDTLDGDEDSDHDGRDNEDEDDSRERCSRDDDDRDRDHVDDEDENDFGYRAGDSDSDDDGIRDGDEDWDDDGERDEDDDDSDDDSCSDEGEDSDDLLGPIVSFDAETGALVIQTTYAGPLGFVVTDDTEIEYDSSGRGSGEAGDATDLVAGAVVTEVDVDDDAEVPGTLEEVELARPAVED